MIYTNINFDLGNEVEKLNEEIQNYVHKISVFIYI